MQSHNLYVQNCNFSLVKRSLCIKGLAEYRAILDQDAIPYSYD